MEVDMLAVITGASSGIGRELALRLAERKYDLILIARRTERLLEISNLLKNVDIKVEILSMDLANIDECKNLLNTLKTRKIDLFVNNAGFGLYGASLDNDTDKEFQMLDLNIKTVHYLTKEILKIMSRGTIINISSMAAFLPTPLLASYAASKSYVYNYSMALAYELKQNKVPINIMTVCPGPVKTEFNEVANASPKMKGLPVEKCVESILKGLDKNKTLVIPSFKMKLLRFMLRFSPTKLLLKISYKIQSKK
jgi:short-subunit dehydrogenase